MADFDPAQEPATDVSVEDTAPAKKEMTAEDVLALLREGKTVENARIPRLKLRGKFERPVRFRNCTLVRPVIDAATFLEDVSFIGCNLDRLTFQRATVFGKNLDLSHTVVSKSLFVHLTVKGQLLAAHTEFRGKLLFTDCTFESKVSFWEAKITAWSDFKKCVFKQEVDFRSMHCEQGFVLTKCHFQENFLFRGSNVEKKFQADGCRFEKLLDFSKAKLHDFVYLEGIEQGELQSFAFMNALAKRILIRPEQLDGRLASERAGDFTTAMHEYGLLKKCYQEQHRFDQEDWAFYRFKVNQRLSKPRSWTRPWTVARRFADWLFLDVGCGYGTNPARAVRTALFIILAFALLYGLNVESFYAEKLPFEGEKTDVPNRIMIGLITSVSVFTSGMGGIREIAKGWMNVPVMIESIMGTLLFGLFIVAFSRKVIR